MAENTKKARTGTYNLFHTVLIFPKSQEIKYVLKIINNEIVVKSFFFEVVVNVLSMTF